MITLGLVAEDRAAFLAAQHVADRCLLEVDWIPAGNLQDFRCWLPLHGGEWLPWKKVGELARQQFGRTFRVSGHFDGKPGAEDSLAVRKVLAVMSAYPGVPDVLVLARDIDGTERRAGFAQALSEAAQQQLPFQVVLALAQPEVEAWFVCTWTPQDESGRAIHSALRQDLGFDPVARSHEMTSTSSTKRDAKEVHNRLAAAGPSPRDRFSAASLAELLASGHANGLAEFVTVLRSALHGHLGYRRC